MDESGAEAIQGVTQEREEFFDSFSADVHGLGKRHICDDPSCVRCCGPSRSGPALEGRQRAGDVRPNEGHPESEPVSYNPVISKGGDAAIEAIDHDPEKCEIRDCHKCDVVIEAMLQPGNVDRSRVNFEGKSIPSGGGGSGTGKRKSVRALTGPERIERHIFGGTPFDEGHTSGRNIGRPRIGLEPTVPRAARIQPKDDRTLEDANVATADILAGFAAAIRMAKNGVSRKIISAAMLDLVERGMDPEVLPESA